MDSLSRLRQFHFNLRVTGAIAPSSARLAAAMASLAVGADNVLELGAGSGAVTNALVKVVTTEKLQAVELQECLAKGLKKRHPTLDVIAGSADVALDKYAREGSVAVVSSLPFRSLPADVKRLTVESVLRFLSVWPNSRLIQFTYGLGVPFSVGSEFQWQQGKWILANFPPACVWVLTRAIV